MGTMYTKHKIIGLTSLILMASGQHHQAQSQIMHNAFSDYTQTHLALGSHGSATEEHEGGESGEGGETGEGGESGEGGFDNMRLETNDVAFLTALKVIEAHYAIGIKLYNAQDYDAAQGFFGHPITEVLSPLQPALKYRKINQLDDPMYDLLEIAQEKNASQKLQSHINTVHDVITGIQKTLRKKDPQKISTTLAAVNADLIRRCKLEYFQAVKNNSVGHLQDSIGYFMVANKMFNDNKPLLTIKNAQNTAQIAELMQQIAPFFKDYKAVNSNLNMPQLAGSMAKIELILQNI